jgi:hypothetical protein
MMKFKFVITILVFFAAVQAVPISHVKETIPTEFLQKFQKAASGVLQPEPRNTEVKESTAVKTAPRSNNPTSPQTQFVFEW